MTENFGASVQRLRDGRSTFDEFVRETRQRWAAMARWLMRRMHLPGWVEPQDIEQDLMAEAWKATWKFEPGRGSMTLERFVRVTAVNETKKRLHKARGANMHTCSGPSRIDLPFAHMSEDGEEAVQQLLAAPATQEEEAIRVQEVRELAKRCRSIVELLTVQALATTGDLHATIELLFEDPDARELLGLRNAEHASRVVTRVACEFASRVELAAV